MTQLTPMPFKQISFLCVKTCNYVNKCNDKANKRSYYIHLQSSLFLKKKRFCILALDI